MGPVFCALGLGMTLGFGPMNGCGEQVLGLVWTMGRAQGEVGRVWLWIVVLMVFVALGGALIVLIRKRAREIGSGSPTVGLSLADLRRMKAEGQLSEEEFERAKAMVIGELGGKVERLGGERVRVDGRIVDGELRARPGFDLTGQPLPGFEGENGLGVDSPDVEGERGDGSAG